MTTGLIQVAVPGPFRHGLTYRYPAELADVQVGCRVKVPLGRRECVGVVIAVGVTSDVAPNKLKSVAACLDDHPIIDASLLMLLTWMAGYYHAAIGDIMATALPSGLMQGKPLTSKPTLHYQLTPTGQMVLAEGQVRAPKQKTLLTVLQAGSQAGDALKQQGLSAAVIKACMEKGWVQTLEMTNTQAPANAAVLPHGITLSDEQAAAVQHITSVQGTFAPIVLHGITGSGKTEVYLQAMAATLEAGKQVLVLVPEIGLTPQTFSRFERRLGVPLLLWHSNVTDIEKRRIWQQASLGHPSVVIGTRSALFVPLPALGLIVVDEEHDMSFKQQNGVRYSARDMAVRRAQIQQVPVVLGTATPSLETLHNAQLGRYHTCRLTHRAGDAKPPQFKLVDMRQQKVTAGLAKPALQEMETHLAQGKQVLVFLNRRGYAPVLFCGSCGWTASCAQCDAKMTLHRYSQRLHCHRCGAQRLMPPQCPSCDSDKPLIELGVGTEQLDVVLQDTFPDYTVVRLDKDQTQRKGAMEAALEQIHSGEAQIMVGTQMLAKGHHFANLTLVVMVDIDGGLFSADFRALERMGQLVTQVAGRAGREAQQGEVLIQTHQPQHPLLQVLLQKGYDAFAQQLLTERQEAQWPPYAFLVAIRAEAKQGQQAQRVLQEMKQYLLATPVKGVEVYGPIASLQQKRAGYYRFQLLLQSMSRVALQQLLATVSYPHKSSVILTWDVDPYEL